MPLALYLSAMRWPRARFAPQLGRIPPRIRRHAPGEVFPCSSEQCGIGVPVQGTICHNGQVPHDPAMFSQKTRAAWSGHFQSAAIVCPSRDSPSGNSGQTGKDESSRFRLTTPRRAGQEARGKPPTTKRRSPRNCPKSVFFRKKRAHFWAQNPGPELDRLSFSWFAAQK